VGNFGRKGSSRERSCCNSRHAALTYHAHHELHGIRVDLGLISARLRFREVVLIGGGAGGCGIGRPFLVLDHTFHIFCALLAQVNVGDVGACGAGGGGGGAGGGGGGAVGMGGGAVGMGGGGGGAVAVVEVLVRIPLSLVDRRPVLGITDTLVLGIAYVGFRATEAAGVARGIHAVPRLLPFA